MIMKILNYDKKQNKLSLEIKSNEDMWLLEMMLKNAEYISGWTTRIYKLGNKEERKRVFVKLDVQNIKYDEHTNHLRILGTIIEGHPEEFIQKGRHQTLEISIGSKIDIIKKWHSYEIKRIKETENISKVPAILVIVMDREKAIFANITGERTKYLSVIRSRLHKDDDNYDQKQKSYFGRILSEINDYTGPIIIAGPGFAKDNFKTFLKEKNPELVKRVLFESCSYAELNGIKELIKKGILKKISSNFHSIKESEFIDKFNQLLNSEPDKVAYGFEAVKKAYDYGAIDRIIINYNALRKNPILADIINKLIASKHEVIIVMDKSENYDLIKSFGDVMAILSFKVNY